MSTATQSTPRTTPKTAAGSKPLENLRTELATMQKRRDEIAVGLATADSAARVASDAVISGTGNVAGMSAARANRDALSEAHEAITAKIEAHEAQLEIAQEATDKTERAENVKLALAAYQKATIKSDRLLREFLATNAAALQEMQDAHTGVNAAENAQYRAGERPRHKPSALEYKQPCGDVRKILAQLNDWLAGTTYVTSDVPAGKVAEYADEHPVPFARLSSAGIS